MVAGIDMPDFFSLVDMQISAGSVGLLGTDAVAVSSASARNQGWELGDEISISYPQLGARSYRIGMIYDTQLPLVSVLLPMAGGRQSRRCRWPRSMRCRPLRCARTLRSM